MLMTGSGGLLNLAVAVLTAGPVAVGGARPPVPGAHRGQLDVHVHSSARTPCGYAVRKVETAS